MDVEYDFEPISHLAECFTTHLGHSTIRISNRIVNENTFPLIVECISHEIIHLLITEFVGESDWTSHQFDNICIKDVLYNEDVLKCLKLIGTTLRSDLVERVDDEFLKARYYGIVEERHLKRYWLMWRG